MFGTSDFSKYMVCPHGQGGGVEPVRTFCGEGKRGSIFAILCGRPLWMAPNINITITKQITAFNEKYPSLASATIYIPLVYKLGS